MRIVVDRTRRAGIAIRAGIDAERFKVQADDKTQVLKGDLEAAAVCSTEALGILE